MMNVTFKKLVILCAVATAVALPTLAQQANPVPGPYQVMVVPVSPRAMTPQNMDPRNVFPAYAPALPYWMQAPQPQAGQQQASPQQTGQTPAAQQTQSPQAGTYGQQQTRQPQVRFLPPRNYSNQQGYGYAPNYGNNYGNNTWGMPSFGSNGPWGNNGNWTNFVPFSN